MRLLSITCFYIALFSINASAQQIQLQSNDMILNAEYLEGDNSKNPVVILHGLLQTHHFSTVTRLATALNESGYTVLSPTLSLGISNRKKSLSCEAIHTHSMNSDTAELKKWIKWLNNKTGNKVNLIGHSAGGTTVLNYLEKHKTDFINKIALISLSYYASGPIANETEQHKKLALKHLNNKNKKIHNYALNYCINYPSYAQEFLSYYEWDTVKVSNTVGSFKEKISIIIGTGDKRIDSDWREKLNDKYNNVVSIEGANHFFDQSHEFELIDTIEELLDLKSQPL